MVGLQYRQSGILGAVLPATLGVTFVHHYRSRDSIGVCSGGERNPPQYDTEVRHEAVGAGDDRHVGVKDAADVPVRGEGRSRERQVAPSHYVITPSSEIVKKYLESRAARASSLTCRQGKSSAEGGGHRLGASQSRVTRKGVMNSLIVRLEDLPGEWLSTMLQMAAAMTSRAKDYTFHGVPHKSVLCGGRRYLAPTNKMTGGDAYRHGGKEEDDEENGGGKAMSSLTVRDKKINGVGAEEGPILAHQQLPEGNSSTSSFSSSSSLGFTNSAVLHIVARSEGDLPINNLVYTDLISQCSVVPREARQCYHGPTMTTMSKTRDDTDEVNAKGNSNTNANDTSESGGKSTSKSADVTTTAKRDDEEKGDEEKEEDLVERYMVLSGAATLECPQPNTLLSENSAEGERRRQIIRSEEEKAKEKSSGYNHRDRNSSSGGGEDDSNSLNRGEAIGAEGGQFLQRNGQDDTELFFNKKREHFSIFLEALQSDVRCAEKDLSTLPPILSPSLRGKDGVGVDEANAANMVVTSPMHPPEANERTFYFWPYKCDYRSSVAYETSHFVVMVNLKPITAGHLMVVPRRVMPTIHSLNADELAEWGFVVRHCALVLRRVYPEGQGLSLAIQQGKSAGQTVPHLHTHVIVYREEGELSGEPEPEEVEQLRRKPRTLKEMQEEADSLRKIFIEMEPLVGEPLLMADI